MRGRDAKRTVGVLAAFALSLSLASCGGFRSSRVAPTLDTAAYTSQGAWTVLQLPGERVYVGGELLAATGDSLYLLPSDCPGTGCSILAVAVDDVQRGNVFKYRSEAGVGGWAAIGAVSSISHGIFLVFTLPMWALSGVVVSHSVHKDARISVAYDDYYLADVIAWTRFPQGLPPELRDASFRRPDWFRHSRRSGAEEDLLEEGKPVRLKKKYD